MIKAVAECLLWQDVSSYFGRQFPGADIGFKRKELSKNRVNCGLSCILEINLQLI